MRGTVSTHYDAPDLIARIEAALSEAGLSPETVTADVLAPIEEFHVGGRMATDALLRDLNIRPADRALDVGCGSGGTSRHAAAQFGCTVEGIDLTDSFIRAGRTLTDWLELDGKVALHCGSALDMPFETGRFDLGWIGKSDPWPVIEQPVGPVAADMAVAGPGKNNVIRILFGLRDGNIHRNAGQVELAFLRLRMKPARAVVAKPDVGKVGAGAIGPGDRKHAVFTAQGHVRHF